MAQQAKRPNFLVILADDLGYSDIGCYGSEIKTPNIDRLAKEGLRFSDYHTAALCSPTRSMIMSGTDCHLAGMGVMYEQRARDPQRFNVPGHEGYLNHDVAAMPELLQDGGYHTMMAGKWHLGYKQGHIPADRGFDRSWALLPGCSNHFGWEPEWEGGEAQRPRLPGGLPLLYVEDQKRYMPEANTASDVDKGFYSSNFYVSKLLSYLKDRQAPSSSEHDKPFFAYLPFSAPHWPLQCSEADRKKYEGKYDAGPEELRKARLAGLKREGLVSQDVEPHDVVASTKEWEAMTAEEKKMSARSMEVYAGMVDRIDQEIGRVLNYLEETGELDNTVVMFFSDNGAEGAAVEANHPTAKSGQGMGLLDRLAKYYDNSYDNLGKHNSFIWYGPRWASAASAPHRLYKGWSTEGGIRVPFVIRYPPFTQGQNKPGSVIPAFSTCMDLLPTFLQLAGLKHPNPAPASSQAKVPYRGHQVYGMRGKSWLPYLIDGQIAKGGDADPGCSIYGEDDAVGWEMHARSSLRRGKWKIIHLPPGALTALPKDQWNATGGWQLYDLSKDRGEINDVSAQFPEIFQSMLKDWEKYVKETGTIFGSALRNERQYLLPEDMVGGDVMDDTRAWMKVGKGKTLRDKPEDRPDVDEYRGQWVDKREPNAMQAPPPLGPWVA